MREPAEPRGTDGQGAGGCWTDAEVDLLIETVEDLENADEEKVQRLVAPFGQSPSR